jgi:cell division protein FtsW
MTGLLLLGVFAMGRDEWSASVGAGSGVYAAAFGAGEAGDVLFLAWFLQTRIHTMDDWKETILPAVLPPLVFIALILKEPDLGTALVCAAVMMLMLYLAGDADEVDWRGWRRRLRRCCITCCFMWRGERADAGVSESGG